MDAREPLACPLCGAPVDAPADGTDLQALERHFGDGCRARRVG